MTKNQVSSSKTQENDNSQNYIILPLKLLYLIDILLDLACLYYCTLIQWMLYRVFQATESSLLLSS